MYRLSQIRLLVALLPLTAFGIAGVLSIAPLVSWAQENDAFIGRVVQITDGDTVTLEVNERRVKIRLAGIDAPERDQPWGAEAMQALGAKILRQKVSVQPSGADGGRILGHLFLGSRDIGRELVREGHAWAYRKYLTDDVLIGDEDQAKAGGRGLWSLPASERMPPWEWRHGGRVERAGPPREERGGSFSCGSKRYCGQMASCAEARFYLKECGLTRLDGDGDGVPCEAICR